MLNVESSTTESDEISNMLSSARRQTNVAISMPEGIFHRAMSRKKSMVDDDLMNAFSLPPIPLDSDIETSSSESESSEDEKPTVLSPKASKENLTPSISLPPENPSPKKISFLKNRTASVQLLNVQSRVGKMGRRLSLHNILKTNSDDQIVTIDKNGVSKLGSRRSSLPLVTDFLRRSPKLDLKASLPGIDETKDTKPSESELEKQKNFDNFIKRRVETISSSSTSSIEEESEEARFESEELQLESEEVRTESQSDEANEDMALGLKRNSHDEDSDPSKSSEYKNDERKGRKSVRQVFKKSFFKSKRSTKKSNQSQPSASSKSDDPPSRLFQRRPSRLEMGIPIEEVFSGIEFKKVEQKTSPVTIKVQEEENDLVEDPDEVINQVKADELEKSSIEFEQDKLATNLSSLTTEGHHLERKKV